MEQKIICDLFKLKAVKCSGGAINQHEEIKVFAKIKNKISGIKEKKEVGKLMVYRNNIIPKAEIVVVNVIKNTLQKAILRTDCQYPFKNQSCIKHYFVQKERGETIVLDATDSDIGFVPIVKSSPKTLYKNVA